MRRAGGSRPPDAQDPLGFTSTRFFVSARSCASVVARRVCGLWPCLWRPLCESLCAAIYTQYSWTLYSDGLYVIDREIQVTAVVCRTPPRSIRCYAANNGLAIWLLTKTHHARSFAACTDGGQAGCASETAPSPRRAWLSERCARYNCSSGPRGCARRRATFSRVSSSSWWARRVSTFHPPSHCPPPENVWPRRWQIARSNSARMPSQYLARVVPRRWLAVAHPAKR